MRKGGDFEDVACAYLSMPPAPAEALAVLRGDPVRVVPLLLSGGYFVRAVTRAVAAGDGQESRRLRQARPVGLTPELTRVIERRALAPAPRTAWSRGAAAC